MITLTRLLAPGEAIAADLALQTAVVFSIALVATRLARRRAVAWRHGIWIGALAVSLALPLGYGLLPRHGFIRTAAAGPVPIIPGPDEAGALAFTREVTRLGVTAEAVDQPVATQDPVPRTPAAVVPAGSAARPTASTGARPPAVSWSGVAILVWLVGVAVMVGRWLIGHLAVVRLLRRARPAPELAPAMTRLAARVGLRAAPRVVRSDTTPTLAVTGWWRPTVIVPTALLRQTPAPMLETLLLHELAHVARRDVLTHQLFHLLRAVHWYDPLVWLGARDVARLREPLADARVVEALASRADYAAGLLHVLRIRSGGPAPRLAAGVALDETHGDTLQDRVRLVLDGALSPRLTGGLRFTLAAVCVLIGAVAMSAAIHAPSADAGGFAAAVAAADDTDESLLIVIDVTPPDAQGQRTFLAGVPYSFLDLRDYLKSYNAANNPRCRDAETGATTTRVLIRARNDVAFDDVLGVLHVCDSVDVHRFEIVEAGSPETRQRIWAPRDSGAGLVTLTIGLEPSLVGRRSVVLAAPPRYRLGELALDDPSAAELTAAIRDVDHGARPARAVIEVGGSVRFECALRLVKALRDAGIQSIAIRPPVTFALLADPAYRAFVDRNENRGGAAPTASPTASQAEVFAAIDRGLGWLAARQGDDGGWHDETTPDRGAYDVGRSGLALLAFLGGGETAEEGPHRRHVSAGLAYLRAAQQPSGCFGAPTSPSYVYNHAIATLALAEAMLRTADPALAAPLQRAVDYVLALQNPYKAWRYGARAGDNDTSVTGWMLRALLTARAAGAEVPPRAMADGFSFIDEMTDPETGRTGYTKRGEPPVRQVDRFEQFPSNESESLTALAIHLRRLRESGDVSSVARELEALGPNAPTSRRKELVNIRLVVWRNAIEPQSPPVGIDLLLKKLPRWTPDDRAVDYYYWYFGTLAARHAGAKAWQAWREALLATVLPEQHVSGEEVGSWDPESAWGVEGGRIYVAAILVRALQVTVGL